MDFNSFIPGKNEGFDDPRKGGFRVFHFAVKTRKEDENIFFGILDAAFKGLEISGGVNV